MEEGFYWCILAEGQDWIVMKFDGSQFRKAGIITGWYPEELIKIGPKIHSPANIFNG